MKQFVEFKATEMKLDVKKVESILLLLLLDDQSKHFPKVEGESILAQMFQLLLDEYFSESRYNRSTASLSSTKRKRANK